MTKLESIYLDINDSPTIMGISLEKKFCERLVSLNSEDLKNQWKTLDKIFNDLYVSHTDSIYEVISVNEFEFFISWLNTLAKSPVFLAHKVEIEDLAEMFSVVP